MSERKDSRTKTLTVPVLLGPRTFDFRLYTRPLDLGPDVRVQYYWMDSSLFRNIKNQASQQSFHTIVGHWLEAMEVSGCRRELDQQIHHVCALGYALVANSKSLQDVYKDAFLGEGRTQPTKTSLPDDIQKRIRRVVRKREIIPIREELDLALGRFEPSGPIFPLLQEAFRRWVGNGVVALRKGGNEGLKDFLKDIETWISRYRKKGGHPLVRQFVNLFSYECKVSFYTCYANTWIDLIPRLREDHGLDDISERFLRFWHHQTQPNEATGERPAFNGQVLALHPLSGFFMKDPSLRAIAGQFFGTRAYDRVMKRGEVRSCRAYWELIGALLTAAYTYRAALDAQAGSRAKKVAARESSQNSGDELGPLRDYVTEKSIQCPRCQGSVILADDPVSEQTATDLKIGVWCSSCRKQYLIPLPLDDLKAWLTS